MSSSSSSSDSSFLAGAASSAGADLIKKTESHVIVFFLFRFLLFGWSCIFSRSSSGSRCCTTSCRSRSNTRPNRSDESLYIARLQSLGEKTWPVWLNLNTSLQDGVYFLWSDGNIVISEDKGSVHAGKFGRHSECTSFLTGLSSMRTRHKILL